MADRGVSTTDKVVLPSVGVVKGITQSPFCEADGQRHPPAKMYMRIGQYHNLCQDFRPFQILDCSGSGRRLSEILVR